MSITVLTLRGTGEPVNGPGNMLRNLTNRLDSSKYGPVVDVNYPASIGPVNPEGNPAGLSEQQSIDASVEEIAAAVRATPNMVGLVGYSLGASCVSRFLELKAQGHYGDCEISWAAFVASPWRAPGEDIDHLPNPGFGISGAHKPWPHWIRTYTVANPQDGITSCPPNSPLRTLAPGVNALTFAVTGWNAAVAQRLLFSAVIPGVYSPGDWINAAALMRGYLVDGQHTQAYLQQGYIDRLAQHLNAF